MLTYFIYCRKSSEDEDRQVASIGSQKDELDPLARRDGLRICAELEEEASAKMSGTRPVFNEMVSRIRKGEANAILCWHLNRLSRNAGDAAILIELMDQKRLLEIRTPSQTFRNLPADKFLITLFCSQAKLENDNKGVDVERGLRKKATMGWQPGVAPLGYLNDLTKPRGDRNIYNDPERFELVKRMWQMMLTGLHTPPQIWEIATREWGLRTRKTKKQGGGPLSLATLYHLFHNPFYYGVFEYPKRSGKWYEGKHEPMITREEFERVQELLGKNGNPRPVKNLEFSYTGLIRCGACNGMITAEEKHLVRCTACRRKFGYQKNSRCPGCGTEVTRMTRPVFRDYVYYHCARRSKAKCPQKSIEVTDLEKQIAEQLGRFEISDAFRDWAFEFLKEVHAEDISASKHVTNSRDKAYTNCVKRIENLVKLKTSPENADGSLLSDEEYMEQRRELLVEKEALKDESPEELRMRAGQALEQAQAAFEFVRTARRRFLNGDPQTKRQILVTMGSNQRLLDKKLLIEPKKPFVLIGDFLSGYAPENDGIEPENTSEKQGRIEATTPEFLIQLRGFKDVRTDARKNKKFTTKVYHFFRSSKNFRRWDFYWNFLGGDPSLN